MRPSDSGARRCGQRSSKARHVLVGRWYQTASWRPSTVTAAGWLRDRYATGACGSDINNMRSWDGGLGWGLDEAAAIGHRRRRPHGRRAGTCTGGLCRQLTQAAPTHQRVPGIRPAEAIGARLPAIARARRGLLAGLRHVPRGRALSVHRRAALRRGDDAAARPAGCWAAPRAWRRHSRRACPSQRRRWAGQGGRHEAVSASG